MMLCVTTITLRRLRVSATTPPTSEKKTIGIKRVNPNPPSASAEPVNSYVCQLMAMFCICDPATEINSPNHNSR